MPKLKITGTWPSLNFEQYKQDYQAIAIEAMKAAARKFLLAAAPKIPVFTGFSRGSLGNLEDLVGQVTPAGRINRKLKAVTKVKRLQNKIYYYKGVEKNNVTGRQFATPTDKIITPGRVTKATKSGRIVFLYESDIEYFTYWDKTRWEAFKAGQEALEAEFARQIAKLTPDLADYKISMEIK